MLACVTPQYRGGCLTSLWESLARERVVDETVDGDVQQVTRTQRDVDATTRVLTANHQHTADAGSEAQEPLPPEAASHQVEVGDIPLEPPGFRPRADLLAELDRAGARATVVHAATGRPGLGTTQLAAAYARAKLADDWRLVAWVNATDTSSLQAGLAAVADATGLYDSGSWRDIADASQAVRHLLETDGNRCLLVFDDAADPEALRPFVPAHGKARVLITSTRPSAANLATGVPVDVFSADEALRFLTARTGLDDEAGAAAVAAALGHLPLALALAASVIEGQHRGYAWYLDHLQTIPTQVFLTGEDGQPDPHNVARAVLLSLAVIRAADPTGVCTGVMEIMAVLSAAGVRRELLHVAGQAGALASGGRRVEAALVDRALQWLSDRSLLTFSLDGQAVIMHRQVAQVVRNRLARRRRRGAVCWAAASVLEAHAITVARSQDRPSARSIPQQVTALLDNTAALARRVEELDLILLRLRFIALYHLIELGDSTPQAIAVGESLTADLERLLGPGHPDTLNSRNSLAAAFLAAGRTADAIPLFEQTLDVQQRLLGPDDPDTLASRNNLAAAYQDAGRVEEAIQLYEQTLAIREQLLGADHPTTLSSRGNLATAYRDGGRAAEAIPLFEQTLAARKRILGPDHPDTQTSRMNLATAYRDGGRVAEAIAPTEQVLAAEETRPSADAARRVLPVGFRRPPADPARRLPSNGVAGPSAKLTDHSSSSRTQDPSPVEVQYDRELVAAIAAGDPAGIGIAYDRYAAGLYGYCHWVLRDTADAAGALQDTFVIAAAMLSDLPEPSKLRPWLYAVARSECRHRLRPVPAARDEEADAANQRANAGQRTDGAAQPTDAAYRLIDATMPFRVVSEPAYEPIDATMPFRAISMAADATMPFRVVSEPTNSTASPAHVNGDHVNGDAGQAELRALIRSVLVDVKPREREVIELTFRHDLDDSDLAIVLGVSPSRANALASRARGRLEKSFGALLATLTGRQACPVLGELLADWDGQLTEQTLDLAGWHVEQCRTCANHWLGALRPAALTGLLPLAPLPPELRWQVLSRCSSTAEDAVAYRQRVVRRAESKWFAIFTLFSRAVRLASWDSIRANPGAAIATAAVAVWAVVAVSVLLLTFAGTHVARALETRPSTRTSASSPAAPAITPVAPITAPTPASASPSLTIRPSPTYAPPLYVPSASPSASYSPTPSKSPKPSKSPSPSPSHSGSPSPSPSRTTSPSPSKTP